MSPNSYHDQPTRVLDHDEAVLLALSATITAATRDAVESDDCDHDWQGWRTFDDGRGGERVCTKCGMGAMHHSTMFEEWDLPARETGDA